MKLVASVVLLLASAGLAACGSTAVNQRVAVENVVRAWSTQLNGSHITIDNVRISKLDPKYAAAQEHGGSNSKGWTRTWFLVRNGSKWEADPMRNGEPITCSIASARVRRELFGTAACSPPTP